MQKSCLINTSGQALLISMFIGIVLLLSIPMIVYVNQMNSLHGVGSFQRSQSLLVAQEGLAYAKEVLSVTSGTWNNALSGTFPTDCTPTTPSTPIVGIDGSRFYITCDLILTQPTSTPPLPESATPYQVHIKSIALQQSGANWVPTRALEAYVSKRTIAVATAEDVRASGALGMLQVPDESPTAPPPIYSGALIVHWGPIICFDTNLWTLSHPLDQGAAGSSNFQGFPRKFSNGGVTGNIYPRSPTIIGSDNKEYWSYDSSSVPPLISDNFYSTAAGAYPALAYAAACNSGPTGTCSGPISPTNGGYYDFSTVSGGTGTFDNTFGGFPTSNDVIYINGNAEFDGLALELSHGGGVVVTGNLTLNTNTNSLPASTLVRIPNTMTNEYYYWSAANPAQDWPCKTTTTPGQCAPATYPTTTTAYALPGGINYHGFLWVKGNLIVQGPNWVIDGTVMVGDPTVSPPTGGQIQFAGATTKLMILYDDIVNHAIQTVNVELQTDYVREVAP